MGKLSGQITFKDPSNAPAIAPGAVAKIQVRNTALACGPAPLVGEAVIQNPTSFPFSYEIVYEEPSGYAEYSLHCSILRDGKLEFINDTRFNIDNRSTLDIFVIKC